MESYARDGFAIFGTGLGPELARLRLRFIDVYRRIAGCENDGDIIDLYHGPDRDKWVAVFHQLERLPEVHGLAAHPAILSAVRGMGIVEPALSTFTPCVRVDMPDDDAKWRFDWHQDVVFECGSRNGVTVWFPVQAVGLTRGPLLLDAGSHRQGVLGHGDDGMIGDYSPMDFRAIRTSLGQAVGFSQFLVHKSGRNRSNKVRFTVILRYSDLACPEYQARKYYVQRREPVGGLGVFNQSPRHGGHIGDQASRPQEARP